jgi:enoyl-CoA hydratase/carnithine racemase
MVSSLNRSMILTEQVLLEERVGEHVVVLTLNRPQAANALNTGICAELQSVFSRVQEDPDWCRAIVLTGAGSRVFSGGGDLKERNDMTDAQWDRHHARFERLFRDIMDCPVPVIAALNGAAIGGGLEIAMCCDIILAEPAIRLALTEVTLGIMPGGFGTQNLPRCVSTARAKEIIFTGAAFTSEQAEAWGLVNRICESGKCRDEAVALALCIAGNAPLAVRQAKLSINLGGEMDRRTSTYFEVEAYGRLVRSEDRREGVSAFNEKRRPRFRGR